MKIGMMNNPARPIEQEIDFALKHNFDFLDLTLEPPWANFQVQDAENILKLIDDRLDLVGHTAWYLPIDSPFPAIQKATQEELIHQFGVFRELQINKVTLHFKFSYPHRFFKYRDKVSLWVSTLNPLIEAAEKMNITVMLENTFETPESLRMLKEIFRTCPTLGFHLDVGHTNLNTGGGNGFHTYLSTFKKKLIHVHLSDNFGGNNDLHLPLGAGNISWETIIRKLKSTGYDDTITLEVFSRERLYLLESREILRRYWNKRTNDQEI